MRGNKYFMIPIFITALIDLLGFGIVIPVLAPLFLDVENSFLPVDYTFEARNILLGLVVASYSFAQFIGAPILGAWSDKYGRKKMLLVSIFGTAIAYFLFGISILTGNLWLMFGSRIFDGFTGGNISVLYSAVADVSKGQEKVRNFGLIGMAFGIGFILGPFIGGKLADSNFVSFFDYATPFWAGGILSTINLFLVMIFYKETLKTPIQTPVSLLTGLFHIKKAFSYKNLRVIFTVILLLTLGFSFFTQFFSVFLIEKFDYQEGDIGNIFAYIGVLIALVQGLLLRPISKRFKPSTIIKFCGIGLAIALMFTIVPSKDIYLYLILPFVAITHGLLLPNYNTVVSDLSDEDSQGEIMGINQSMQAIAQGIPPIIAGIIVAFNINYPIIAASLLTVLGWLVFVLFFGKKKERKY